MDEVVPRGLVGNKNLGRADVQMVRGVIGGFG